MNFERFVADHAITVALAFLAALFIVAAFLVAAPARSQQIEIGPGGFSIRQGRSNVRVCEELRRACMYKEERGEEGMGNCRRYRETCQY